jgi:hypothetical protein
VAGGWVPGVACRNGAGAETGVQRQIKPLRFCRERYIIKKTENGKEKAYEI